MHIVRGVLWVWGCDVKRAGCLRTQWWGDESRGLERRWVRKPLCGHHAEEQGVMGVKDKAMTTWGGVSNLLEGSVSSGGWRTQVCVYLLLLISCMCCFFFCMLELLSSCSPIIPLAQSASPIFSSTRSFNLGLGMLGDTHRAC